MWCFTKFSPRTSSENSDRAVHWARRGWCLGTEGMMLAHTSVTPSVQQRKDHASWWCILPSKQSMVAMSFSTKKCFYRQVNNIDTSCKCIAMQLCSQATHENPGLNTVVLPLLSSMVLWEWFYAFYICTYIARCEPELVCMCVVGKIVLNDEACVKQNCYALDISYWQE